ncbi:uncharacterized protein METZ01_LOCUS374874, partial [marine metagenome]
CGVSFCNAARCSVIACSRCSRDPTGPWGMESYGV